MLPTESTRQAGLHQVSLYDYLAVIKRHIWWGALSFFIIFTAVTLYTIYRFKPVYRAKVVCDVETTYQMLGPTGEVFSPKIKNHLHLLRNQETLFKALQRLGLLNETSTPSEREQQIANLARPLTLSLIEGSSLIEINYDDTDPVRAAHIVNTIVRVYEEKLLEDKEEKTDSRGVFIKQQLFEVTKQLEVLERRLQEMKASGQSPGKTEVLANKLIQLELSYMTQSSQYGEKHPTVIALEQEMSDLKKQMAQLQPDDLVYLETLRQKKVNENLCDLLNTRLKEVQIELADKAIPFRVISWALVPGSPINPTKKMILIIGAVISLLIGLFIIFLRQALDLSIDTPERLEEYLKVPVLVTLPRFKRLSQHKTVLPETPRAYSRDERELMERLQQLDIKINLKQPPKTIAVLSPIKAAGKTMIIYYYGCAAAEDSKKVLLVDTDNRKPDLHKRFNLPREPGLTEILHEEVPLSQALHAVRIALPQDKMIKQTAVPDTLNPVRSNPDMMPRDAVLPLAGGSPNQVDDSNEVCQIHQATLYIITSGRAPLSPIRLFSSPSFDNFLATIRESYDLILFDTPPILLASEVPLLCRKIDGCIIVHKPTRFDRYILGRFKSRLMTELKDKCYGIVLNNVRDQEAYYYYRDYYR